jgi:hypothetical protein
MKRLTRQRRSEIRSGLRLPLIWGGLVLGALLLFGTLLLLERGARLDVPDLPAEDTGQFLFYSSLKKSGSLPAESIMLSDNGADERAEAAPPVAAPKKQAPSVAVRPPVEKDKSAVPKDSGPKQDKTYSIQVAASKEKAPAEAMVGRLKEKGYPAYFVHEAVPNKGRWYRVRVGPYIDRDEARRTANRLSEKEQLPGFLVMDEKL